MFLQILPPDYVAPTESVLENELFLVVAGLAVSVFVILKVSKILSKSNFLKGLKKPIFSH